jgi:hypothetical protein
LDGSIAGNTDTSESDANRAYLTLDSEISFHFIDDESVIAGTDCFCGLSPFYVAAVAITSDIISIYQCPSFRTAFFAG